MITRHGKIARLPHEVREELNQRLYNGAMGPELLPWLNQSPAAKEVLAQFFNGAPINAQNLSDWRHGGYEDWLRHQERELRIQRVTEEGTNLAQREKKVDLFENFARIAVAELTVDMDSLAQMDGEQRWNRLRSVTRELARLQNGYNRSRWTDLAWTKWNDRFQEPPEPVTEEPEPAEDQDEEREPAQPAAAIPPAVPKTMDKASGANPPATATETLPTSNQPPAFKVDQPASKGVEANPRVSVTRVIYHRKNCGCVCKNCHPLSGEYTYAEAVRDTTEARQHGAFSFWRGSLTIVTQPKVCNCPCTECAAKAKIPIRHLAY